MANCHNAERQETDCSAQAERVLGEQATFRKGSDAGASKNTAANVF